MAKRKPKLDVKVPTKRPPFIMAEPNDDAAAFNWELRKLRHPSKDKVGGEVWPGPSVFTVESTLEDMNAYGHDLSFINPSYLQMFFDRSVAIRQAAEKVRAAKYSTDAIAQLRKTVLRVFREEFLPDVEKRFGAVAGMVAEFYAARIAHIDTFGFDGESD